eukprot:CAMPEP_0168477378 /NCGR_PEP_ID=MMETSP0228-20121227/62382_1 /TAXON_ID=133427 /ORGANISM="Protoceratium reticulatum, Strain CCCM 535 (=CCMP 1889)" /LENGTH=62 /DNA_ID=CAMNT_0008493547 /DNA_START=27 /DNA_END=212 /DNA_ORIENTATION=+
MDPYFGGRTAQRGEPSYVKRTCFSLGILHVARQCASQSMDPLQEAPQRSSFLKTGTRSSRNF